MKPQLKKKTALFACLAALGLGTLAQAEDLYVAQTALGTGNGSSAANAYGVAFFNTASNWASGAGKISAGDTVHLVGTISTTLTVQGSGNSGSPITILFESGAKLSAAYWGIDTASAIYAEGKSYIVIDGNSSGIIECTANGDALANNQPAYGITLNGGSNNTVQNLTVQNIYIHTSGVANKVSTYATRCIFASNISNLTVRNCTLKNAYMGVYLLANGMTIPNGLVERNTIAQCSTAVVAACGGLAGDSITNFVMRYNDVSMGGNWYEAADLNHIDGIHTWTGAGTMSALNIYGNYFHGNPSANCTAPIYLTDNLTTCFVYNNLLVGNTTQPAEGYINLNLTGTSDAYILNNTIVGLGTTSSGGNGIAVDPSRSGNRVHLFNNIISNCFVGFYDGSAAASWDSDYNTIYNCGSIGCRTSFISSLAAWQSAIGGDNNSSISSPNLSPTYFVPVPTSSAIGTGNNLSTLAQTLGITLTYDITGALRTTWDRGMVKSGISTWAVGVNTAPILPPSNGLVMITVL